MPERITEIIHVPADGWATNLIAPQGSPDYRQADVQDFRVFLDALPAHRLIFLLADASIRSVSRFLQILDSSHAVALLDPNAPAAHLERLREVYHPHVLISAEGIDVEPTDIGSVHPELKVMLSTSGTTGSSKFVRLSRTNIEANADQIIESLAISETDIAATVLPLYYSFGMSVVTSHARAGAPIVVTDESLMTQSFWELIERTRVTFFPVVPQSLGMLDRIGLESRLPDTVRVMVQAGGRVDARLLTKAWQVMHDRGGRLHVMYGQTEASPRIACLAADAFPERPGSVGRALPGGSITIETQDDSHAGANGTIGEIVYQGPNVMMGYAEKRADLVRAADTNRSLRTGDLGYLDGEGFLFITGRLKRIAKLASTRVSLDEVEALFSPEIPHPFAVIANGSDGLCVCIATEEQIDVTALRGTCARILNVPTGMIAVRQLPFLPLLSSGKVDYPALSSGVSTDEEGAGDDAVR